MTEGGLPEASPRVYLLHGLPKLGLATSELPEELAGNSDAKVSFPA